MIQTALPRHRWLPLITMLTFLTLSPFAIAKDYVPFPGKLQVHLLNVDAANIIYVNFESWPGFRRGVRIILPRITLPADTPLADDCEREKAARALAFTQEFTKNAGKLYIKDLRMQTSADPEGYSDLYSDKQGSLIQSLKQEGLARDDSVPTDTSWCD